MKAIIRSQYKAALAMFTGAIEACDDALWFDDSHYHPSWRVAYHTLFFADLYLCQAFDDFTPWEKHVDELESLGPMPHKNGKMPRSGPPYAKHDILEYASELTNGVDARVEALDLNKESGFFWLEMGKLEHQFYNIRHIQHHAGQLCERVREARNVGVDWVGWVR